MEAGGYSTFGCDVGAISLPQQMNQEHVCSRHCSYHQIMGNMWQCSTSGTVHVCDQNCNQRIYYDQYRTICRLSKRLFENTEGTSAEMQRKRSSDIGLERVNSRKKSLSTEEWAQHQDVTDAATLNTSWAASEVAAWSHVKH